VVWLNNLIESVDADIENSAIAMYTDTSSANEFSLTYVWQQAYQDGYDVVVRCAGTLVDSLGMVTWGRYSQPPHPVIANRGPFSVIAFAADNGIAVCTTTDSCIWSDPVLLPGSGSGSKTPFVMMDVGTEEETAYIVTFENPDEEISIYRSVTNTTITLSKMEQLNCKNPTAARLGSDASVVYQFHNEGKDKNYIARVALNLADSTVSKDYDVFGLFSQTNKV
jgi:hypothetical protein